MPVSGPRLHGARALPRPNQGIPALAADERGLWLGTRDPEIRPHPREAAAPPGAALAPGDLEHVAEARDIEQLADGPAGVVAEHDPKRAALLLRAPMRRQQNPCRLRGEGGRR